MKRDGTTEQSYNRVQRRFLPSPSHCSYKQHHRLHFFVNYWWLSQWTNMLYRVYLEWNDLRLISISWWNKTLQMQCIHAILAALALLCFAVVKCLTLFHFQLKMIPKQRKPKSWIVYGIYCIVSALVTIYDKQTFTAAWYICRKHPLSCHTIAYFSYPVYVTTDSLFHANCSNLTIYTIERSCLHAITVTFIGH